MTVTAAAPTIPAQIAPRNPDTPWKDQTKYAVTLMRRLWGHDPETCEELIEGLYAMGRAQLGRVIDNLMWTLADQPRPINAAQLRHIRALWARKMRQPIDAAAEAKLAAMTEEQAQRLVFRMQAQPDIKM
jgi:hypothetical protein